MRSKLLFIAFLVTLAQPALAQSILYLGVSGEAHQTGVDVDGNFLDVTDISGQPGVTSSVAFVDTTGGFGGISSVHQSRVYSTDTRGIEQLVQFEASVSATFGELAHGDSSLLARIQTSEELVVQVTIVCSGEGTVDIEQVPQFVRSFTTDTDMLQDSLVVDCDGRLLRDYIADSGDATFTASGMIVLEPYVTGLVENAFDVLLNAESSRFNCESSMSSIRIDFTPPSPSSDILPVCDVKLVSRFDDIDIINSESSLAIDGDTVLICDPQADLNGVEHSGAVHEYRLINSYWTLVQSFQHPNAQAGDSLGIAIELLGDTIAVQGGSFLIYIFERTEGGDWAWVDTIPRPALSQFGQYARNMVLSDDIDGLGHRGLLVSDTRNQFVYVFTERLGIWILSDRLDGDYQFGSSNFSWSVELSHDSVILSAPTERVASLDATCDQYQLNGSVYIYGRDGIGWELDTKLLDPAPGIAGQFGSVIEVDGDVMAVSSVYSKTNFNGSKGSVQLYRYDGSQWIPEQKLSSPKDDCVEGVWPPGFGSFLGLSGDNLVVGDKARSTFFWYTHDGTKWVLRGQLPNLSQDHDVTNLQISGNTLAIKVDGYWDLYILEPGPDDPAGLPTFVSSYATPDLAREVTVIGTTAYVADGGSGLQVLDVSDLASPTLIGSYDSQGFSQGLAVVGSTAYIADGVGGGLLILDVSDPTSPIYLSSYDTPGNPVDLTVVGDRLYVPASGGGLLIFDVSNPTEPELLGSYEVPDAANSVELVGSTAYLAAGSTGLLVLDVSVPTNPSLLGTHDSPGYASGIAVRNSIGYLSDWTSGLRVLDLSDPLSPNEIAFIQTEQAGTVKIEGDSAYVADSGAGLKIIDISDPADPFLSQEFDTPDFALDVFIDDETVFIADNSAGLQIISMNNCATQCLADLTGDGSLDIFDVLSFIAAFNVSDPSADFTGEGSFDIFDVLAFIKLFNTGCP